MKNNNGIIVLGLGCLIVLIGILSFLGIFLYSNNSGLRYFFKGKISYELGQYQQSFRAFSEYLSFAREKNGDREQKARYYLASSLMKGKFSIAAYSPNQDAIKKRHFLAQQQFLHCMQYNKTENFYAESVIGYAEIARWYNIYNIFIVHHLNQIIYNASILKNDVRDNAYMLLGYQYLFNKEFSLAKQAFVHTSGELSRLGEARVDVSLGNYDSAFFIYQNFIQFYSNSIHLHKVKKTFLIQLNQYAKKNAAAKKYEKAIEYYKKLIYYFSNDPIRKETYYAIAKLYVVMGNYKEAEKFYKKTLNYQPQSTKSLSGLPFISKDSSALYQLGSLLAKQGKTLSSRKFFTALIERYPTSIYVSQAKKWILQLENDENILQQPAEKILQERLLQQDINATDNTLP